MQRDSGGRRVRRSQAGQSFFGPSAAFWRLGEAVIVGHMTLNPMTILSILSPSTLSETFSLGQLQALAAE